MSGPKPNGTNRRPDETRLLLSARFTPPRRIASLTVHPELRGNRNYLRALRAAEMAAWEAGLPLAVAGPFAKAVASAETN